MRNWLTTLCFIGSAILLTPSCKKDEVKTVLVAGAVPTLNASSTTLVLEQANANDVAVTFTWSEASFGFDAAIKYELQIAKGGTNFASASTTTVELSNVSPFSRAFKVIDFNKEMLKIINYGEATQVEARVIATVTPTASPSISNVVAITVTAYRDLITYDYPNALNVAGNFQGWDPGAAMQIVKQNNGGFNGYEGYLIFNAATPEFKLVKGDNWGGGDHGDAGGGMLTASGGNNLKLPSGGAGITGYYRLWANTTNLTWGFNKIDTWGVIGGFNGWGASVAMNFDAVTRVWSVTLDMPAGEFKFRANNDWALNFGDNNNDGRPEYNGSNLNIPSAGNYTISLDLSVGGNYAYVIKKN